MKVYEMIEPTRKISRHAVFIWRLTNAIGNLITIVIITTLLWLGYSFDWRQWLMTILWIAFIVTIIYGIWSISFQPKLLQKYWRYNIDEQYIRLRYGILTKEDVVVPMTKIQYVEANQGPLLRKYQLYSLTIGTISSSHEIPALPADEAFALRDQISQYAKLKEVE